MKLILEDNTNKEQFEVYFTDKEIIDLLESYAYDKLFEQLGTDERLSNISIVTVEENDLENKNCTTCKYGEFIHTTLYCNRFGINQEFECCNEWTLL